jgi:nitroreductase
MTELTVADAAFGRVSIRKYEPGPIPRQDLERMLDIARRAPSPWNLQPWRMIVVEDEAERQKLMEAAYGQPQVGGAPAVFVIYSDMADSLAHVDDLIHPGMQGEARDRTRDSILSHFEQKGAQGTEDWGYAISYIFVGYLLLAAQSMGYVTSPMLGFDPAKVRELYGLPEHVRYPAIVSVGRPAEEGFTQFRKPASAFTRYV